MSSSGMVHEIRRKVQGLAYSLTTPEMMSRFYFRVVLHRKLDLKNPRSFNEKIQWYKLNYCAGNREVIECADKYRIRNYLKRKGLADYAVPMLGYWENVEDIPWSELPDSFAIKCNHGCAYNIICRDRSELDLEHTKRTLKRWLKEDFGSYNAEPHYSKIQRGVICEKYLGDGKSEFLIDYKIHCFNGTPQFVLICSERSKNGVNYIYYDREWNKLPYSTTQSVEFSKPESFDEMVRVSAIIAADFPFVRVDFYEVNGKPMIGELTFVPAAGLDHTLTREADEAIGALLNLNGATI